MTNQIHQIFVAKIKIIERRWQGLKPNEPKIPPKETTVEKESGSFLLISLNKHQSDGIWGEENQSAENQKRVDFEQKEGFRIFISPKLAETVNFSPETRLRPISGDEFPVRKDLPLEKQRLKKGEHFMIEPHTMDYGVRYEISVLDIFQKPD